MVIRDSWSDSYRAPGSGGSGSDSTGCQGTGIKVRSVIPHKEPQEECRMYLRSNSQETEERDGKSLART